MQFSDLNKLPVITRNQPVFLQMADHLSNLNIWGFLCNFIGFNMMYKKKYCKNTKEKFKYFF